MHSGKMTAVRHRKTFLFVSTLLALSSFQMAGASVAPSATTLANQVSEATAATALTNSELRALPTLNQDNFGTYLNAHAPGCLTFTGACDFGTITSKVNVVVFGDSHAVMWLPAIVALYGSDHILLRWRPSCGAAKIPVIDLKFHIVVPGCEKWRRESIPVINALHPKVTIIAERTSHTTGPSGSWTTDAQWKRGLTTTLKALKAGGSHPLVLGDIPALEPQPASCLSINPTSIQKCTVQLATRSMSYRGHVAGERAAAHQVGVPFINTEPWLCDAKRRCPAVVAGHFTHADWSHLTMTYAAYLSQVFRAAVPAGLR